MRLPLIPHPSSPHGGLTLDVEARRREGILSLDYALAGPVERVLWPDPAPRERTDELWRTTCFEVFVTTRTGYIEFNLSPSGAWAAYTFDGYREAMRDLEVPPPLVVTRRAPGAFALTVDLPLPDDATAHLGLTAVIEGLDGTIGYWGLAHPSDKPDFHHRDSFVLELP